MTILAPPTVIGPVLESSPFVRVDGVLATATVRVVAADGTVHAEDLVPANGTGWLPVSQPFQVGTVLRALQRRGADQSDLSVTAVPVVPPPTVLPRPVFAALLNQCSGAALISGLVPGAKVTIKRGGTELASEQAIRTDQWLTLNASLSVGDVLTVEQTLPSGSPSPAGTSESVVALGREQLAVPTLGALAECQASVSVGNVVATAYVTMAFDDGAPPVTWVAPDTAFQGGLRAPVQASAVTVWQELPGCGLKSEDGKATVAPEVVPPQPQPWAFCPQVRRIRVDNLVTQATVKFTTASWDNNVGGWGPETELMLAGAVGGTQEFDLPKVVGGGPGPIVSILVRQSTCTKTSEFGSAREYIRPGEPGGIVPTAQPHIVGPLYACQRRVRVSPSGWGQGVLRSRSTGQQLADAFSPKDSLPVEVRTWFGLTSGDEVVVEYTGCSAPNPTSVVVVEPADPIPNLKIIPPLPGDTDLVVTDALADAQVVAVVGGKIRAVRTAGDATVSLPLGLTLTEQHQVWAYQRLCGVTGNRDGAIPVRRGTITATCSPASATAGQASASLVTAMRVDTGQVVNGLPVLLNGKPVGVTGSNFGWAPSTPGALSGTVKGGPRYTDATFTITVSAPPPPAPLQLTMQLGGAISHPVSISKIGWRVEPHWGGAAATANGNQAIVSFPSPPGGSPVVSVYITDFDATYSDAGGTYPLALDAPAPVTNVAFTKPSMHAGFLMVIDSRVVYDGDGLPVGTLPVAVVRWQGTA